jgi:hypothetical protein
MDQADLESEDADLTLATREYGWFAVTLLCLMALLAFKLQS